MEELERPLTAIEEAELLTACRRGALTEAGLMLLRRALFELGELRGKVQAYEDNYDSHDD